jgi:hypothetical protein
MMAATEYKMMVLLPSGQNSGAAPKMVLEIGTILIIVDDSNFSWT